MEAEAKEVQESQKIRMNLPLDTEGQNPPMDTKDLKALQEKKPKQQRHYLL